MWASQRVGRPITWTAELAMDAQGNLLAMRVKTIANMGAHLSTFASSVPTILSATRPAGQYETPAIHAEVQVGTLVNPMIVEGQVHGGPAQGLGQAMLEGCVYDTESGQLLTGSYMDHTMPRADDLPSFTIDPTVTPCTHNPLGVKACGEAGAIGSPPAFIYALTDALGTRDIAMPATAERVWRAANKIA